MTCSTLEALSDVLRAKLLIGIQGTSLLLLLVRKLLVLKALKSQKKRQDALGA